MTARNATKPLTDGAASAASVEHVLPYGGDGGAKTGQVRQMFDNIAPAYDRMNALMSLGMHRRWLGATVDAVARRHPATVLDVATGTGDVAIALARRIKGATVTGIDVSAGMVGVGNQKVRRAGLDSRVRLTTGDALQMPFADGLFDALTVAYGVRNFENLEKGYAEMLRVLRPGGMIAVLELTPPSVMLLRPFYDLYTRVAIPVVARFFTKDVGAYRYLPRSIAAVPARSRMCALMHRVGFADSRSHSFAPGVCTLYTAVKPG